MYDVDFRCGLVIRGHSICLSFREYALALQMLMDAPVLLLRDPSRSLVSEYSLKKGSRLITDLTSSYDVLYTVNPFHLLTESGAMLLE